MFGKGKKTQRGAHLKMNTAGTSNELSFDVLEAASRSASDKKGAPSNVVDVKSFDKAGGMVSLLFSKVAFPSKRLAEQTKVEPAQTMDLTGWDALPAQGKAAQSAHPAATGDVAAGSSRKQQKKEARAQAKAAAKAEKDERSAQKSSLSRVRPEQPYSQESAQVEVNRRKGIRRRHRARLRVAVAAVAVVALGAAGYFGYQHYQLISNQSALLEGAVSDISKADEGIVQLDALLSDPMGNVEGDDWAALKGDYESMQANLDSATKVANELLAVLGEGDMRTAAGQVVAACEARSSMLSAGEDIFSSAAAANEVSAALDEVWEGVLSADTVARDGVSLMASDSIDDSVQQALGKLNDAQASFASALSSLRTLEGGYSNLDLSAQKSYLEKRIEAIGHAAAAAQALIDRNKEEASSQAEQYTAADAEAVKLAAALPDSPHEPVNSAFEANKSDLQGQYDDARYAASAADDRIRDYLGV